MAELRYGIVTFKGEPAGELRETSSGGTEFAYYDGAPQIACGLPRAEDTHTWAVGVHPVFAHLAPEGWLRARQEAIADATDEDDLGLLLAFGKDCIGAIGIDDPEEFGKNFSLSETIDAETRAIAESQRTISGVQAKILCQKEGRIYRPALHDEPAPYIAKFAREDLTDLIQNEELSLELCQLLLGSDEVTHYASGYVADIARPGLIVERFDRIGPARDVKLRCEDFAQVLAHAPGRRRENKYNADYADLTRALQHSSAPKIDAQRIFKRLIAFALLGNTDCHFKNWSLLETDGGLRLSPVYDVVNGYVYAAKGYNTRFGLQIDGERIQWEAYDRDRFTQIAERLELTKRAADRSFAEIFKLKNRLFERLDATLPLSEERAFQFRNTVNLKWEQFYG